MLKSTNRAAAVESAISDRSRSTKTYWIETLGCPKNQVDSDKIESYITDNGLIKALSVKSADLIVVNTCAFIEEAREESIDTIFSLVDNKKPDSKMVVTGCLAERYTRELKEELKEVDLIGGFGTDVLSVLDDKVQPMISRVSVQSKIEKLPKLDLLNLTRSKTNLNQPWAYVKIAEGCDRKCGFCAIPSFRGKQVSRSTESILEEITSLDLKEVILVAQDIGSYGNDLKLNGTKRINLINLVEKVSNLVEWVRILYIYPTNLNKSLIDLIASSPVPYFDLSLQHASSVVLKNMRRYGSMEKFLEKIDYIRKVNPNSTFRTSFLIGYPGETEKDHDILIEFIQEAQLDWVGFFKFSREKGTYADSLENQVPAEILFERLNEAKSLQDDITLKKRNRLIGEKIKILCDSKLTGRSYREAPDIDGLVRFSIDPIKFSTKSVGPESLRVGDFVEGTVIDTEGVDLVVRI